jgi:secernin
VHDPRAVWWQWQHLLDVAKDPRARDFTTRAARLRARFDDLEARWEQTLPSPGDTPKARTAFALKCLDEARATATGLAREFGADPAIALDSRWAAPAS